MHYSDPMLEIISPPLHYKPTIPNDSPLIVFQKAVEEGFIDPTTAESLLRLRPRMRRC